MRKSGIANLILHSGYAPNWLVNRMEKLAQNIFSLIIDEYGLEGVLTRLSNPLFFQALSNVLGFDWNSSGSTTVTCNAIKKALADTDLGLQTAGGKGRYSRMTPKEINEIGRLFNLSNEEIARIRYASRMTAKVDNAAIQAGYPLYHHTVLISMEGSWVVIQQGMNITLKAARRYQWLSKGIKNFVVEPHQAIVGEKIHRNVLDLTAGESKETRNISVELVKEGVNRLRRLYKSLCNRQRLLTDWLTPRKDHKSMLENGIGIDLYSVPLDRMNWKAIENAWKLQPQNFEELLSLQGIGPSTVRGLALVSELIYGEPPSWKDPVKYSFAFGGKDGVPFPVDRKAMDEATILLEETIQRVKLGDRQKIKVLKRLVDWKAKIEILK